MNRYIFLWVGVNLFIVLSAQAQAPDTSRFQYALLDRLTGEWTMTGQVMGDSVQYNADAEWLLDHQFLRLHMTDVNDPPEYSAHVYVGYDSTAQQYVAHWLNTTGAGHPLPSDTDNGIMRQALTPRSLAEAPSVLTTGVLTTRSATRKVSGLLTATETAFEKSTATRSKEYGPGCVIFYGLSEGYTRNTWCST